MAAHPTDRTFAEVSAAFAVWKKVAEQMSLSAMPPEVIEETHKQFSVWLAGFNAGIACERKERDAD